MKRFEYSLATVLDYKTQILDNLKSEHAVIVKNVNTKQEEIMQLKSELNSFQNDFDQTKSAGAPIQNFRLYDMCIGRMEEIINEEKERLNLLKKKEEKKKEEVITAKVDTSKFEKLKGKKMNEYYKAEAKAEEAFVEEFVVRTMSSNGYRNRGER